MKEENPETTLISQEQAWKIAVDAISAAPELNYLTMVVCRIFEHRRREGSGLHSRVCCFCMLNLCFVEYTLEWQFSPGCTLVKPGDHRPSTMTPHIVLHRGLPRSLVCLKFDCLDCVIHPVRIQAEQFMHHFLVSTTAIGASLDSSLSQSETVEPSS